MSVFSERLNKVMAEKNIKGAEIARATGISTGTISKYLNDPEKKAAFEYVIKISDFLDVDPSWLGGLINEMKPFKQPTIIDIFDKLSEAGKKQVFDYANYILNNESAEKDKPK